MSSDFLGLLVNPVQNSVGVESPPVSTPIVSITGTTTLSALQSGAILNVFPASTDYSIYIPKATQAPGLSYTAVCCATGSGGNVRFTTTGSIGLSSYFRGSLMTNAGIAPVGTAGTGPTFIQLPQSATGISLMGSNGATGALNGDSLSLRSNGLFWIVSSQTSVTGPTCVAWQNR